MAKKKRKTMKRTAKSVAKKIVNEAKFLLPTKAKKIVNKGLAVGTIARAIKKILK